MQFVITASVFFENLWIMQRTRSAVTAVLAFGSQMIQWSMTSGCMTHYLLLRWFVALLQ